MLVVFLTSFFLQISQGFYHGLYLPMITMTAAQRRRAQELGLSKSPEEARYLPFCAMGHEVVKPVRMGILGMLPTGKLT